MSYSNGATVGSVPAFFSHSFTVLDESSSTYLPRYEANMAQTHKNHVINFPFNISFLLFLLRSKSWECLHQRGDGGRKRICFGGNIVKLPQLQVN